MVGSRVFGGLDVWVQPIGQGEARRVTSKKYDWVNHLTWTEDGHEVVYDTSSPLVFRAPLTGGEPQPIPGVGQGAAGPTIRASRMVHEQWVVPPTAIWRLPGRTASRPGLAPAKLIASSGWNGNMAYSPDGRRIAFSSTRTGVANIWVCDADGSNPVQLTSFERTSGTPRWSPDGRNLTFDSVEAGDWNIYVVDAEGGKPRRLTGEASNETLASWSRDGRFIYFSSDRSGRGEIWKMPSTGGEAVQVTRGGGFYSQESWDGRDLYYARRGSDTGIWRVPVSGGDETEVLPGPFEGHYEWTLSRSGIYYATTRDLTRGEDYTIRYLDLASGRASELYRKQGASEHAWLAVSPGEEWLLFTESEPSTSELMLVENFR
jgi:dipeptidyl aminopeptidase/acylaminoacyl peptidase